MNLLSVLAECDGAAHRFHLRSTEVHCSSTTGPLPTTRGTCLSLISSGSALPWSQLPAAWRISIWILTPSIPRLSAASPPHSHRGLSRPLAHRDYRDTNRVAGRIRSRIRGDQFTQWVFLPPRDPPAGRPLSLPPLCRAHSGKRPIPTTTVARGCEDRPRQQPVAICI